MNEKRLSQLRQMEAQDPTDPFFPYAIAQEHMSAGQYEEAVTIFRDLLSRFPAYVAGYHHAGIALAQVDEIDEALVTLKKGISVAKSAANWKAASEMQELVEELSD